MPVSSAKSVDVMLHVECIIGGHDVSKIHIPSYYSPAPADSLVHVRRQVHRLGNYCTRQQLPPIGIGIVTRMGLAHSTKPDHWQSDVRTPPLGHSYIIARSDVSSVVLHEVMKLLASSSTYPTCTHACHHSAGRVYFTKTPRETPLRGTGLLK